MISSMLMGLLLGWDQPETRVDGQPLYTTEISHYELYLNGEYYDQTTGLQLEVSAYGDYQVRCIAVDGTVSEFSNTVTHAVVKGRPTAPGQLRKLQ